MTSAAYHLGGRVRAASATRPYVRAAADPIRRPLRVFAVDPSVPGAVAVAQVPWEPLAAGPAGALFVVEPLDLATGAENRRADLDTPALQGEPGLPATPHDPCFHQQMVYAVASVVYEAFQIALGRDPSFAVPEDAAGRARLRLLPHGPECANAWYEREHGAIVFGRIRAAGGFVFTSLSHDIVAHEVTHALVDGLRSSFARPTNPDVPAFHEALADLVAVFARFSYPEVVRAGLHQAGGDLTRARLLADVARQMGHVHRGGALRSALDAEDDAMRVYDPTLGPHALGAVLVSAVFDAFTAIVQRKAARHVRPSEASTNAPGPAPGHVEAALAREASAVAGQFLTMCLRALDYCPPVDIELGEFLRAAITADRDLMPEDPWGYRQAWIEAFRARRIFPPGVTDMREDTLAWSGPDSPIPDVGALACSHVAAAGCEPGMDGIVRQAHAVGSIVTSAARHSCFGLVSPEAAPDGLRASIPVVESVRAWRRIGPHGRTRAGLVGEVTQDVLVPAGDDWVRLPGGSTIVFGEAGQVRYVIRKGVTNAERRRARVEYSRRQAAQLVAGR